MNNGCSLGGLNYAWVAEESEKEAGKGIIRENSLSTSS